MPGGPVGPVGPGIPVGPATPGGPVAPESPVGPRSPGGPVSPAGPGLPGAPAAPGEPGGPTAPAAPGCPAAPVGPGGPGSAGQRLQCFARCSVMLWHADPADADHGSDTSRTQASPIERIGSCREHHEAVRQRCPESERQIEGRPVTVVRPQQREGALVPEPAEKLGDECDGTEQHR